MIVAFFDRSELVIYRLVKLMSDSANYIISSRCWTHVVLSSPRGENELAIEQAKNKKEIEENMELRGFVFIGNFDYRKNKISLFLLFSLISRQSSHYLIPK